MRPGELRINTEMIGKPVEGKLLRPDAYATVGILLDASLRCVAMKFYPVAGDAEFKEPVVVALAEEDVDSFIRAVRIAHAGLASDALKGGTS